MKRLGFAAGIFGVAAVIVVGASCKGGLQLDARNGYACDPKRETATSPDTEQCPGESQSPPLNLCGVNGRCQPYLPDGLPDGVDGSPERFSQGTRIAPLQLQDELRFAVTRSTRVPGFLTVPQAGAPIFAAFREGIGPLDGLELPVFDLAMTETSLTALAPVPGPGAFRMQVWAGALDEKLNQKLYPDGGEPLLEDKLTDGVAYAIRELTVGRGPLLSGIGYTYVQRAYPGTAVDLGTDSIDEFPPTRPKPRNFWLVATEPDGGMAQLPDGELDVQLVLDARPVPRTQVLSSVTDCGPVTLPDGTTFPDGDGGTLGFQREKVVVPLALTQRGLYLRTCRAPDAVPFPAPEFVPVLDRWTALNSPADPLLLPTPSPFQLPPTLKTDRALGVVAVSFAPGASGRTTALSSWRFSATPGVAPSVTRLWPDCTPCGTGRMLTFQPLNRTGPAVDVLCEESVATDKRSFSVRRVVGSTGSTLDDACDFQVVKPSFALDQIASRTPEKWPFPGDGGVPRLYALSTSVPDGIVAGGKHGQVWYGESFDDALPLFLDDVPDEVSVLDGQLFTLNANYVSFPFFDGGFGVVPPTELSGDRAQPILPRTGVTGLDGGLSGWTMLNTSDFAKVIRADAGEGQLSFTAEYGPQLLAPSGLPAPAPYFAQDALQEGKPQFFVVAGDSLYQADRTRTPTPREMPPILPVLTPQPGAAIRSFTLDRSAAHTNPDTGEGKPLLTGYMLAATTLYRIERTPERWSSGPVALGGGEPVEVWMRSASDPRGRVGFRDGHILSLPQPFELVGPLPTKMADGSKGPTRVIDFANVSEIPVALTDKGLYVATPGPTPLKLQWSRVQLPAELEGPGASQRYQRGKLHVDTAPSGAQTLYLFTDFGFVYRIVTLP